MKKWSRIVLLVVLICLAGFARQTFAGPACPLALEWQPCPDPAVAGYVLYYGATGEPLTNRMDVGPQTVTVVKGLPASVEYTFYVVAYDADRNEGDPSDPLLYVTQAISPLSLSQLPNGTIKILFRVASHAACRVEYTDTLTPPDWQLLFTTTGDANGDVIINLPIMTPSRFYRAVTQ